MTDAPNIYVNKRKLTGRMLRISMVSHQAELIEVCKQPPGLDVGQAVCHLKVCECSQKDLKATRSPKENRLRLLDS